MLEATSKLNGCSSLELHDLLDLGGGGSKATELTPFISFDCILNAGEEGSTRLLDVHNLPFLVLDCWDVGCSRLPPFFSPYN